jgi:Kef-type K+ transport system membrane component KefB
MTSQAPSTAKEPRVRGPRGVLAIYAVMVAAAIGIFIAISRLGERAMPSAGGGAPLPQSGETLDTLFHVLVALAVIIIATWVVGHLFRRIQQPPVIGEVVGGILLGPSLLGWIAPSLYSQLLPPAIAPILGVHAQVGVILYMFLVGLELDLGIIRRSGHATVAISHASIIVPFLLGSTLALAVYPSLGVEGVPFTLFALFLGVSMSVTAFPVLARILRDQGISRSRMGTIALACAAVDDATAWCMLALVVSIAQARAWASVTTLLLTVLFIAFVLVVVVPAARPLVAREERAKEFSRTSLTVVFVAILASAVATEYIGIHALFGAFLLGAVIPSGARIASELNERLEGVIVVLFLPVFFAFTGMRTEIGLISTAQEWALCGPIVLVACAGKFGGTLMASRLVGFGWRDAAGLGLLMNTRGLVELIVLNIGLDLGILSPTLFTMLVIMALVTTFMTSPLLHMLLRNHPWEVRLERKSG